MSRRMRRSSRTTLAKMRLETREVGQIDDTTANFNSKVGRGAKL